MLAEISEYTGESDEPLKETAKKGLKELLAAKDGPTIRWYYDQVIGSPRTSIEHVISNTEMFEALAEILPGYLPSLEDCKAVVVALHARLTER